MGSTPISGTRIPIIGYNETYERKNMNRKIHSAYIDTIDETKEGCLAKINKQIVIIKKVKSFEWSWLVIYTPCNLPGFKVARLSKTEPLEFYTY